MVQKYLKNRLGIGRGLLLTKKYDFLDLSVQGSKLSKNMHFFAIQPYGAKILKKSLGIGRGLWLSKKYEFSGLSVQGFKIIRKLTIFGYSAIWCQNIEKIAWV